MMNGDDDERFCQMYLDDIIVASKTCEQHMDHLRRVFEHFRVAGMKLSPKKCRVFKDNVRYVSHTVSSTLRSCTVVGNPMLMQMAYPDCLIVLMSKVRYLKKPLKSYFTVMVMIPWLTDMLIVSGCRTKCLMI